MENSLPRPDVAARALRARRGPGEWLLTSWLKRVRKGRLVVDLPSEGRALVTSRVFIRGAADCNRVRKIRYDSAATEPGSRNDTGS